MKLKQKALRQGAPIGFESPKCISAITKKRCFLTQRDAFCFLAQSIAGDLNLLAAKLWTKSL
jgi:hypothetical protein